MVSIYWEFPYLLIRNTMQKKIVTEEIGLQLSFREITKVELLTSIIAILNNPKYVQIKYVDIMTAVLKNTLKVKQRYKLNNTD
jgi:hypothetical protein